MNKNEIKSERIYLRCTYDEKKKIKTMADNLGVTVSELIIYSLNEGSSYNNLKKIFSKIRG